ncbi:LysM peptidoglycan-binding domain-containing protein [Maricaulis sp.]|uniref:LysM peptidoglycan-binding domain-containing protein n=1 Tax=Maricaulis sp. TaxID=1486257 RepID=UPI003A92130E
MTATRSFIIAAALAALAIAAALAFILYRPALSGPAQSPTRPDSAVTAGADAVSGAQTAGLLAAPVFDIVRVAPAGTAVIAGRGEPGAAIIVLANGDEIARETVNDRGEWVIILNEPLPSGAIELGLVMQVADGRELRSEQVVLVSIPESRGATPLVVVGRPGEASRVWQCPSCADSEMGSLVLETVDYDETGAVIFAGRAEAGSTVRIFANGALVGSVSAGADGRWTLQAGALLAPGRYDLQVDQLDADGNVTAVIALPFERVAAEDLNLGPDSVIVQPGNSLWRLARQLYGRGVQYTVIYEANRSQIRDPDLIYPGQVLRAPDEAAADVGGPDQG